ADRDHGVEVDAAPVGYCKGITSVTRCGGWSMDIDLSSKRVAVLGAGKMGGILLNALLQKRLLRPELTCATVAHEERAASLRQKLGIAVGIDNVAAVRNADIVLIGLKPQVVEEVVKQIQPVVTA